MIVSNEAGLQNPVLTNRTERSELMSTKKLKNIANKRHMRRVSEVFERLWLVKKVGVN
jgi:hypothetical protein